MLHAVTTTDILSPQMGKAGLKAFFRIMEDWDVKTSDAIILLGRPGRSTFFKWKRGDVESLPYDTMCRISYMLGIYKALHILFSEPSRADEWIKKPNGELGGQSALDRMLGGSVTDLAHIREYLDSIRGGGWS